MNENDEVASHLLIAIEPGKHICGVAVWGCKKEGVVLLHASSLRSYGDLRSFPTQVEDLWFEYLAGFEDVPPQFVFEIPRYYKKKRRTYKGVDALYEVLDVFQKHGILIKDYVYPSQWKGNLPKDIHRKRIQKALTWSELRVVDFSGTHDMWDAIGIGLFATGRTGRAGIPVN